MMTQRQIFLLVFPSLFFLSLVNATPILDEERLNSILDQWKNDVLDQFVAKFDSKFKRKLGNFLRKIKKKLMFLEKIIQVKHIN